MGSVESMMFPGTVPRTVKDIQRLENGVPYLRVEPSGLGGKDIVPNLIFFHGNITDVGAMRVLARRIVEQYPIRIWLLEYRGYGPYPGPREDPSNLLRNADLLLNRIKEMFPSNPVVIAGQSIGTGPAAQLAAANSDRIWGLILISPFTSIRDLSNFMIQNTVGNWAAFFSDWLVPDYFPTQRILVGFSKPLVLIHGAEDTIIPIRSSEILASLNSDNTYFFKYPNRGHNFDLINDIFIPLYDRLTK